jgi:predicted ATPase
VARSPAAQQAAPVAAQLRDALAHLYDPTLLETHPLAGALGGGKALRRALEEAVGALAPARDGRGGPKARRRHELLALRYLEGLAVETVQERLAIGRSEYYREHERALAAVASLLGERLHGAAAAHPPGTTGGRATAPAPEPGGILPVYLSTFVGREAETAEVAGLLSAARLLTLTGPGGSGKTRLAVHVAAALAEDGSVAVWFVDLAPLADPALVPGAVLAALGLREAPGRAPADAIAAHLRGRAALLLLDNCEHLIEACARVAEALLGACRGLRVLATSREPLGVPGETVWRVPPLPTPPAGAPEGPADVGGYAAVRLFAERARAAQPSFVLSGANAPAVAEICRWLDGMPLALELAAARVPALPVEEVATRLGDLFRLLGRGARTALPRHQTLRALVDWSHDLLDQPERAVFARLSVFAGSFGLEAAERVVAGGGVDGGEVLDLVARLIDKSLVLPVEGGRYRLLQLLRQYGQERLQERGEADAVRAHHAAYYLDLAERLHAELERRDAATVLARVDLELDNLRAGLAWYADAGDAAAGLRLLRASLRYWYRRGRSVEQLGWAERFLGMPGADAAPPAVLADVLAEAAQQVVMQGKPTSWSELASRAVAAGRAAGDPMLLVTVLARIAIVHLWRAEPEAFLRCMTEIEALCRQAGEHVIADLTLADMGFVALLGGDLVRARAQLAEHVAVARRAVARDAGYASYLAGGLEWLGGIVLLEGDHAAAAPILTEALALFRQLEDRPGEAHGLLGLGLCAVVRGDAAGARSTLREALELIRQIDDTLYLGFPMEGLAGVALLEGRFRRALVLGGAAEASRAPSEGARWPMFVPLIDRWLARARAALAPDAADAAWREGLAMSFDQAVEYALGDETDC